MNLTKNRFVGSIDDSLDVQSVYTSWTGCLSLWLCISVLQTVQRTGVCSAAFGTAYFNPYSARIDFRRQNLMSVDVRC